MSSKTDSMVQTSERSRTCMAESISTRHRFGQRISVEREGWCRLHKASCPLIINKTYSKHGFFPTHHACGRKQIKPAPCCFLSTVKAPNLIVDRCAWMWTRMTGETALKPVDRSLIVVYIIACCPLNEWFTTRKSNPQFGWALERYFSRVTNDRKWLCRI